MKSRQDGRNRENRAQDHAHARGTYDLEEAAPRPAEHPLGRAAYRSRSASRVVAAHEVGVATGRSDGTDGPDGDRGRDEEKADGRRLLLRSPPPPPPMLFDRPYRPNVRRQGTLLGELLPESPYAVRASVRPNVPGSLDKMARGGCVDQLRTPGRTDAGHDSG